MENIILIVFFIFILCYIIYDSIPRKYTELDETFKGYEDRKLIEVEYEKSPLHTIVYGATSTGKTYFVRQCLKLYEEDEDKDIILVCKDENDWIRVKIPCLTLDRSLQIICLIT